MKQKCPYCNNEIEYEKGRDFSRHCANCKSGPGYLTRIEKLKNTRKIRKKRKLYCKKCGNAFYLELTDYQVKEKTHRTHCSYKCSNSRVQTKEQNERRRKKLKGKTNVRCKGKSYEEIYGAKKAYSFKIKLSKALKYKGKLKWTKQRRTNARKIKNIDEVFELTKNVFRYETNVNKTKFLNNRFVRKLGHIAVKNAAKRKGLTLDNIAEQIGEKFFIGKTSIGTNETDLLNDIELEKGIKLERQYYVVGKFIDGYDPINNVAYEVDELHHRLYKTQDLIREDKIKKILNCQFVRIRDGW